MPKSKSKYEFWQQASLSQKVSNEIPILQKLSGSDREISDTIGIISYFTDKGMIDKESSEFILGLLDILRLSHFATSDKINEISKMGFMLPKGPSDVDMSDAHE